MPKSTVKKEMDKLTKILHPKSRKTAAISKNMKRASSREKTKLLHSMRINLLAEKVLWFKEHLDANVTQYTPELTLQLVEGYLQRNNNELDQIHLKHSIGNRNKNRQHASREDILKLTKLREEEEFDTCGLELPDLMNEKELNILRKWNGELRFLQNSTLTRYNRGRLTKNQDDTNCDVEKATENTSQETMDSN